MIGKTLSHYRILGKLGSGGMGDVYRAQDGRLGREVALKVLSADLAADRNHLSRFKREAQSIAAMNHPNVVTIYTVEEVAGLHFLTMELIDGHALDELLPPQGFPFSRLLDLAVPMTEGVATAHGHGIVHRDLKPSNVMVTNDGRVKVLDFGLAKRDPRLGDNDSDEPSQVDTLTQTKAGVIMGTPHYMSPQQAKGERVDHRSDVFSLGVILFEMATGRRPFEGETAVELLSCILRDAPPPLRTLRPDLPEAFEQLVRRCLQKEPGARCQDLEEVLEVLRDLQRESRHDQSELNTGATVTLGANNAAQLAQAEFETLASPQQNADTGSTGNTTQSATGLDGFWVAVMPFQTRGAHRSSNNSEAAEVLAGLAADITEEVVTGLSRFSYLRVLGSNSTLPYAHQKVGVQTLARELGARYVLEGSLRRAGSNVRIAASLVDAETGDHLWAEKYDRPFDENQTFELIDDVVPRIVSTSADMHGVLPRAMSESLRGRSSDDLSSYEAVLRSFGYIERLTSEEHERVRGLMEDTVARASDNADALAMLSFVYAEEFKHGFNEQPGSLDRSLDAARKAVAAGPTNNLAHHVLAQALFFRRELPAFRNAAQKAVELNPMDGGTVAFMGILMGYAGDWERGAELAAGAMDLNPNHPGWYHFAAFFNAYRQGDYQAALDAAYRMNLPSYFHYHGALAMAAGQLGERGIAERALEELLEQKPDIAETVRSEWVKWMGEGELLELALDGFRKAGLAVVDTNDQEPTDEDRAGG